MVQLAKGIQICGNANLGIGNSPYKYLACGQVCVQVPSLTVVYVTSMDQSISLMTTCSNWSTSHGFNAPCIVTVYTRVSSVPSVGRTI